jgi:hypothetical protein
MCFYGFTTKSGVETEWEFEPHISEKMPQRTYEQCAALWDQRQLNRHMTYAPGFIADLPRSAEIYRLPDEAKELIASTIVPNKRQLDPLIKQQRKSVSKFYSDIEKSLTHLRSLKNPNTLQRSRRDKLDAARQLLPFLFVPTHKGRTRKKVPVEETQKEFRDGAKAFLKTFKSTIKIGGKPVEVFSKNFRERAQKLWDRRNLIEKLVIPLKPAVDKVIEIVNDLIERADEDDKAGLENFKNRLYNYGLPYEPTTSDDIGQWLDKGRTALKGVVVTVKRPDGTTVDVPFEELMTGRKAQEEESGI